MSKGMPNQIGDLETELALLRKYAAMKPNTRCSCRSGIFGLANRSSTLRTCSPRSDERRRRPAAGARTAIHGVPAHEARSTEGIRHAVRRAYEVVCDRGGSERRSTRRELARESVRRRLRDDAVRVAQERTKASDSRARAAVSGALLAGSHAGSAGRQPTIPELEQEMLALGFRKRWRFPPIGSRRGPRADPASRHVRPGRPRARHRRQVEPGRTPRRGRR